MEKLEIFDDIVNIMHNDYSGWKDKKGLDSPEKYRKHLIENESIDDLAFVELVREYILDFKEPHAFFSSKKESDFSNGFTTRRYGNKLYIVENLQEDNLEIGDAIVEIDGQSIEELAIKYRKFLGENHYERENWKNIIKRHKICKIESDDGSIKELVINKYSPIYAPSRYEYKEIDKKTSIITLTDFADEAAVQKIIDDNGEDISGKENLIIDVRHNAGGSDTSYFPLLKYIFPSKINYGQLFENESMSINYSERNCKNSISAFKSYLQMDLDDFTSNHLKAALENYESNFGKGFVEYEDGLDFEIKGQKSPKNIFVLTDVYCGSSGDMFAYISKKSPKVTVVGRNTLGVTDYSNLAIEDYGEFEFSYPTSRMSIVDEGLGINGKGVDVDIYIPWTPRHLKEDVDLNYVLNHIDGKS